MPTDELTIDDGDDDWGMMVMMTWCAPRQGLGDLTPLDSRWDDILTADDILHARGGRVEGHSTTSSRVHVNIQQTSFVSWSSPSKQRDNAVGLSLIVTVVQPPIH
jgi:hypothetical protein